MLILIAWVGVFLGSVSAASNLPVPEKHKTLSANQQAKPNDGSTNPNQQAPLVINKIIIEEKPGSHPVDRRHPQVENAHPNNERMFPPSGGWAIVYVTAAYVIVAIFTLLAIRQQAQLVYQNIVLIHRPRLIVRNVVIRQPNMQRLAIAQEIKDGQVFVGQLYVSNIGGTPATVREAGCWVFGVLGQLPMERPYEGYEGNNSIIGTKTPNKLFPGESGTMHITMSIRMIEGVRDPLKDWSKTEPPRQTDYYVMGWITYADDLQIVRRTAFCRRWDFDRQYFVPVNNPDYEHAE